MDTDNLKVGDILLSTGGSTSSAIIRAGMLSRFSHTALYIGNNEVIETTDIGVTRQSLDRAMSDDTLVAVYRHMQLSPVQADQIVRYATMQIGKPFDYSGSVGSNITPLTLMLSGPLIWIAALTAEDRNRRNPERGFFCSELVAFAYEKSGISLGRPAYSTTPQDVASSQWLRVVGYLKES